MPSYISHIIFGEDINKKLAKDNINYVEHSNLKMYSLGADLSYYSKCSYDSHNKDTKKFFIEMIKYIKNNNLEKNNNVISYLYGHIGHYFLDKNVHPLIYSISNNIRNYKLISSHTMIETYIDYYLVQKKLNLFSFNIKADVLFNGNYEIESLLLTDYIYKKVYGIDKVSKSYKKVLKQLKLYQKVLNIKIVGNCLYKNMINFIEKNNLKDIVNNQKKYWKIPSTGKLANASFMELYNKSLSETIKSIKLINEYLYNNKKIEDITFVFDNSSYDTGIDCDYKKYIRK